MKIENGTGGLDVDIFGRPKLPKLIKQSDDGIQVIRLPANDEVHSRVVMTDREGRLVELSADAARKVKRLKPTELKDYYSGLFPNMVYLSGVDG